MFLFWYGRYMRWYVLMLVAVDFFGMGLSISRIEEVYVPVNEFLDVSKKRIQVPIIKEKLLPDLLIYPPKELFISRPAVGKKTIRFNTTVANIGRGPFEVIGHTDKTTNTTYASQYIKNSDGTGSYKEIGQFIFHDIHKHWHVEDYVQYQIWTLVGDNSRGEMLTRSDKMSFCLWDVRANDLTRENAPQTREYTSVCSSRFQGISVGWEDTYLARVEGQEIDISSVTDGIYLLEYEVNPDRNVEESDYDNNSGGVKIEIAGNRIKIVE